MQMDVISTADVVKLRKAYKRNNLLNIPYQYSDTSDHKSSWNQRSYIPKILRYRKSGEALRYISNLKQDKESFNSHVSILFSTYIDTVFHDLSLVPYSRSIKLKLEVTTLLDPKPNN